ncbi:methionine/alanine import family NSS transporter small subunit [Brevibacterium mcbrellneri]|nr:methionine/alanine import family NSS transporter small subunit [Brevibacterium mcbrellneri]
MSTPAIIMMLLSMVTVWGGLGAAIVHLKKHSDVEN